MSGKQRQAQRTKNNARPSSSSRSAEKLGTNLPSFIGFSADRDGGYVTVLPGFSTNENIDSNLDPTIQVIFRKMCKKDSTTKLKALNEFTAFINFSDEPTVCTTLSFWPKLYSQLSADCNHRVREASQIAHFALVTKCGRSIAPYLKQIIPVWIASQYDIYMPAKSQAKESFDKMFPVNKVSEVMTFCRKEIMNYIHDNLILHTPTTLSNAKIYSQEECESIYERTIVMSLQAYELFLDNLVEEHFEWLCDYQTKLLDNSKFWDLAKHKSPLIRSSFYGVIGCLSRKITDWFNPKYGEKAVMLLFSKLCEKDADVVTSVLENSILLMAYMTNCWDKIDYQSKILNNIFNILSEGGYNNATRVGPLLAPLLVQLLNMPNRDDELYNNFFNSICKGLEHRCVVTSKGGYDAWLLGLVECLKHFANANIKSEQGAQALSQPIRSWINATLCPKIPNSSFNYKKIGTFYLANISIAWTRESISTEPDKNTFYSHIVRLFWKNILFVISSQLENVKLEEEEIKKLTDVHIEFMTGLKNANGIKKKKAINVKFQDSEESNENNTADKLDSMNSNNDDAVIQNHQHGLNKLVYDTCASYLLYAKTNNLSSPILTPLFSLISEFNTPSLHEAMYRSVCKKDQSCKIVNLYNDCYDEWLRGDSMRSPVVVDLVFTLMTHLSYDEQLHILKSFNHLPLPVIKWCISRCIAYPYSSYPAIGEWLLTDTVHQSLLALSKLVVREGDKNYLDLLKMCFMQSDNGAILISPSTSTEITKIFQQAIYDISSEHLNMCALFACTLSSISNIQSLENHEIYCNLLISLLTLDCNLQKTQDLLPDDTILEINTSWRDGLSSLSSEKLIHFAEKASIILHAQLLDSAKTLSEMDNLVTLSLNLIESCVDAIDDTMPDVLHKIVTSLLRNKCDDVKNNLYKMSTLSMLADILNNKFSYVLLSDSPFLSELIENNVNGETDFEVYKILSWILYTTKILNEIVPTLETHIENEKLNSDQCSELQIEYKNNLIEIIYNFAVLQTLFSEYKMCKWFDQVKKMYSAIDLGVSSIFDKISKSIFVDVYEKLKQKADTEGLYWTKCVYLCDFTYKRDGENVAAKLLHNNIAEVVQKLIKYENIDELFGHKFCHNIQLLIYETDTNEDIDLKLKISGIIAMRHLYSRYTIYGDKSKLKLSIEDLLNVLSSPIGYLPIITDVHFLHKDLMLYDTDVTNTEWYMIHCNSSIAKFLTLCVNKSGWDLKFDEWDFIMISLSSLVNSMNLSKNSWKTIKVSTLGCAVFELYCTVNKFVNSILSESVRREPSETIVHLLDEWRELFSPEIHKHVIDVFMAVSSDCIATTSELSSATIFFTDSLSRAMQEFDLKYLDSVTAKDLDHTSMNLMEKCLDIMASPNHHIFKYMANTILKLLTPSLINGDKAEGNKSNASGVDDAPIEPIVLSVHAIEPTLIQLQGCVEAVLAPYKVGLDHCTLLPFSDGHSIALGYLLIWEILLDIAQESTAYLQHEYSEFFRQGEYVDQLLNVLFRLLPDELTDQSSSAVSAKYFKTPLNLSHKDPITWESISGLACHRLLRCLQGGWLGALVRNWWGSLPTRTSQFVEGIVRTHVSPILIANQFSGVVKNQSKIPNIEISIHNSVNEIVCVYVIEDLKMGLTIQLCNNHPLNKPNVVSSGTALNNMAWLSMYLSHQNGSIYQAIKMWANAVQKKVESTPVCYVCYCRLHPTSGQLPKMFCQTCKNKFHTACLNRWFSTSGKTTCPMCRNVFNV